MPTRKATATWEGGLKGGRGNYSGESGGVNGSYSAGSRFAEDGGSNPEELLAAAHAACFSMALAANLERGGTAPERVDTEAACVIEKANGGFTITTMRLRTRVRAPGLEEGAFREAAEAAKEGCPVAKALAGVSIELDAQLE